MANLVKMKVTRRYPRRPHVYGVGAIISVPEHVAKSMEEANPPFGKRVKAEPATTPTPPATPKT